MRKKGSVRVSPTAAAAQYAGFRACKRRRPDSVPDSPEWDVRADLVARAMRLIADGVVDREGVARRLSYAERHVRRLISTELGAGPLALARARRAHTARLLIETTDLPITELAFAAGFTSIRQFNNAVREVFAVTPRELRRARRHSGESVRGEISLRLSFRTPLDAKGLFHFLGSRAVSGVEAFDGETYMRTLRLPHGTGTVALSNSGNNVHCVLRLEILRSLAGALAGGEIVLDPRSDREEADRRLLSPRGIGPWTASYTAMRALGDPDAFVPTDLDYRRAVSRLAGDQRSVAALAERWSPWRGYATQYLWASLGDLARIEDTTKREVVA